MKELRDSLIGYLSSKMHFRSNLAERAWRKGGKNENYAKSLQGVIDHIEKLPDNDQVLQDLAACAGGASWWASFGHEDWEDAIHQMTIHCGDKYYTLDPDGCADWFRRWAAFVISEVRAHYAGASAA